MAIITGLNVQKDEIDRLDSERFAKEHKQDLLHFYSIDDLPRQQISEEEKTSKSNNLKLTLSIKKCKNFSGPKNHQQILRSWQEY